MSLAFDERVVAERLPRLQRDLATDEIGAGADVAGDEHVVDGRPGPSRIPQWRSRRLPSSPNDDSALTRADREILHSDTGARSLHWIGIELRPVKRLARRRGEERPHPRLGKLRGARDGHGSNAGSEVLR